jgi:hypothetical protein
LNVLRAEQRQEFDKGFTKAEGYLI